MIAGVFEVNPIKTSDLAANQEKACCHVKMEQIKSDMLLCAPFVKSLKVFIPWMFYLINLFAFAVALS